MKFIAAIAFAAGLPLASAHYFFPNLIVNGNFTGYNEFVRETTQGFMPLKGKYDTTDFRCNTGSLDSAKKTGVYKVKAGDEIGFGLNFGGQILHPGPMQAYMSKAPGNVQDYDGSGDWFKVYENGPVAFSNEGIQWGSYGHGNFTFTLPKETPAGQYLVRIEHVAVHGAGDFGGAELYLNCAQIEVESTSTATPGPLVKIPGVYTGYEPGILFYMYRPYIVNFTMPGPARWPQPLAANVTAQGVDVCPTYTPWTLPAVSSSLAGGQYTPTSTPPAAATTTTAPVYISSTAPTTLVPSTTSVPSPSSFSAAPTGVKSSSSVPAQYATTPSAVTSALPTRGPCGGSRHYRLS